MTKKERNQLKGLQIDALHTFLAKQFSGFMDKRDDNLSITMQDALMSGYAVFSLKCPSLLQFNNQRTLYAAATGQAGSRREPKDSI